VKPLSLVITALVAVGNQAPAAQELPDIFSYRAQDLAALRQGFAQPPAPARPWAHWFWWNSIVSREEIARELEEMAAAGFGGVELRVATFQGWGGPRPAGMDAATLQRLGHRQLEYLSGEWLDTPAFTLETAERLGLRFAINLGQGWPPGGPWITDGHRTKHVVWKQHEVTGPAGFKLDDLPDQGLVLAWKLAEDGAAPSVLPDSFLNLDPFIHTEGGGRMLNWPAPAGRWLVGVFAVTPGGLCDKGEGPEVDPASREAVLFHLNYMLSQLDSKVGRYYGKTLVDAASDSWEYTPPPRGKPGRYWSPAILEAFPRLAGYDLRGKMHALLGYGPEAGRVIHDLENVERQLVRDNFFKTVAEFLHARGLRHRPQIYGRGLTRDLLEAYLDADTPEVEQGDCCVSEAIWAAHTTSKPIVSCEAFTHLHLKLAPVRRPHGEWESNPSHLRAAANWLYSRGVNRIQYHSFSYSPPGLPLPGWRMYAETHLNRNVPWWPDLPALNTWMARQQWLLQAGAPVADALVYPAKSNPPDGPFGRMGDRQPVSAANAVDAANEFTLPHISRAVAAGQGEIGHVLLLDELKTVAEAESVLALMDSGAKLVCARSLPERWPALRGDDAHSLRERFAAALTAGRVVDATAQGWQAALAELQSARWSPPSTNLVFQHRRVMGADVYVLFNFGDDFRGEVSFPQGGWRVDRFDTDTGAISPVAQLRDEAGRVHLPLALPHAESSAFVLPSRKVLPGRANFPAAPERGCPQPQRLRPGERRRNCQYRLSFAAAAGRETRAPLGLRLRHAGLSPTHRPVHVTRAPGGEFDYDAQGRLRGRFSETGEYKQIRLSDGTGRHQTVSVAEPLAVTGPWQLSVSATQAISPQTPLTLTLDRLVSWRQLPELKHYAGRATYRTEVDIPPHWVADDWGLWLDLGEVFELARVSVNGREAGVAYTPPYRVDLTGMVKPGRNILEIEVPNQLKNHLEKGDNYRRPSGLLGPVRLVPERRITLASLRPLTPAPPEVIQTNVFVSGEGGYHTYRIPALIETPIEPVSQPSRVTARRWNEASDTLPFSNPADRVRVSPTKLVC
jgi:hypothetical protein